MASGRVTCLLCARPGLALRIKQTPLAPQPFLPPVFLPCWVGPRGLQWQDGAGCRSLEKSGRIDEAGSFLPGLLASLLTPCNPASSDPLLPA